LERSKRREHRKVVVLQLDLKEARAHLSDARAELTKLRQLVAELETAKNIAVGGQHYAEQQTKLAQETLDLYTRGPRHSGRQRRLRVGQVFSEISGCELDGLRRVNSTADPVSEPTPETSVSAPPNSGGV
jgi:hypothetical protein